MSVACSSRFNISVIFSGLASISLTNAACFPLGKKFSAASNPDNKANPVLRKVSVPALTLSSNDALGSLSNLLNLEPESSPAFAAIKPNPPLIETKAALANGEASAIIPNPSVAIKPVMPAGESILSNAGFMPFHTPANTAGLIPIVVSGIK